MKLTYLIPAIFIATNSFISNAQNTTLSSNIVTNNTKISKIRYYYYPNIQSYFDSFEKIYYFKENGEWVSADELPKNYGGYSLYNLSRVAIEDFDGEEPYLLIEKHKKTFPYKRKGY